PREFTAGRVQGRRIAMTTTNGTRALRACSQAQQVLIGSFLGLTAMAEHIRSSRPQQLLLVCAGTHEEASYEDTLAAGALAEAVWPLYESGQVADSASIARQIFRAGEKDLLGTMRLARNGRRLLSNPELRDDVPYCVQRDTMQFLAAMSP